MSSNRNAEAVGLIFMKEPRCSLRRAQLLQVKQVFVALVLTFSLSLSPLWSRQNIHLGGLARVEGFSGELRGRLGSLGNKLRV